MSIQVLTLEPKQPWEQLGYVFDMSKAVPSDETFSSVAFAIYNDADSPSSFTDLASTMIDSVAYDNTLREIEAVVKSGTSGITYVLRGRLTCSSGNKYEVEGRIRVSEIG